MHKEIPFRATGPTAGVPPPLVGWVRLTPTYFDSMPHRTDLSQYFDGAAPDWRDILHPELGFRPIVAKLAHAFDEARSSDRPNIHMIHGATGEGKSTVLMQSVRQLMLQGSFDAVYWRRMPDVELSVDQIASLGDCFECVLFASDDAESLAASIDAILKAGLSESRITPHFLLAARDTDWISETRNLGWSTSAKSRWLAKVNTYQETSISTIDINDSAVVVTNWANCSPALPSSISDLSPARRAEVLRSASVGRAGSHNLIGGLLKVRFTPEQLESRLASLLERTAVLPPDSTYSLAGLLIALAAVDIAEIEGLPAEIVARYFSISQSVLRPTVQVPLRREFAVSITTRKFHSRHRLVSEAILKLVLDEYADFDFESAVLHILDCVQGIVEKEHFRPGYGRLIDLGRRLADSGNRSLASSEFPLQYIRKAISYFPKELSDRTSLSKLLRESGRAGDAIEEVWRDILPSLDDETNWNQYEMQIRATWHEICTAFAVDGDHLTAYVCAFRSLSDRYSAPIDAGRFEYGLNQLAFAAFNLHTAGILTSSCAGLLVAADSTLRALRPGTPAARYVENYRNQLGLAGTSYDGSSALVEALKLVLFNLPTSTVHDTWRRAINDPSIGGLEKLRALLDRLEGQQSG